MDFLNMEDYDNSTQTLVLVVCLPVIYSFMLWLGRWLKRRHGVQLRWPYHLFAVCLAVYGPAKLFRIYFPYRRELAALTCILGAGLIVTLLDRYVWDLYFKQRHRIKLPRFLDQVT